MDGRECQEANLGLRIEDYALIGDCQTAALVGIDGLIDWLCFPQFDSRACFAALLGTPDHGRWLLAPTDPVRCTRRAYRDRALVLETEFETDSGTAAVIDLMPVRSGRPDLVRIVEGRGGCVRMQTEYVVRFDYGCVVPWVYQAPGELVAVAGPDALHLQAPVPLHGQDWKTVGSFDVTEGERVPFVLTWHQSYEPRPARLTRSRRLTRPPSGGGNGPAGASAPGSGKTRSSGHSLH